MNDRPVDAHRWEHLEPDPRLLQCLREADGGGRREDALRAEVAGPKKNWSQRFADACARMVADELRTHRTVVRERLRVLPGPTVDGDRPTAEPATAGSGGSRKKVDVIASSLETGLRIGFSLKGGNFRDARDLHFDKNLTGRMYEVANEMRVVHEHNPRAFMTCLYFLPLGATCDKPKGSSFAHVVQTLRKNTGRIDPLAPGQMYRADLSIVGLYVPGDVEVFAAKRGGVAAEGRGGYSDAPFPRGAVRYFNVSQDPPRTGRPMLDTTLDLHQMVEAVVSAYSGEGEALTWAPAEPDHDGETPVAEVDPTPITGDDD